MTRRLLISYLTLTLFVLLLLEVPLAIVYQQREADGLTVDAERDATVLATLYEDALEDHTTPDPTHAEDYASDTSIRVVVVDTAGVSIIDTSEVTDRDFSTRPEIAIALTGNRATGTRHSNTLDTDLLYVAVPVASGGTVHGAVRVTLDTSEVTDRVHRFWLGLAGVAIVILAAVAAVGWTLAKSVTGPVRRLQATASRFSSGDLTQGTPNPNAPSELADLENSMNTMATRLERLLAQQREFVADASHQLRTPLTALRLRLENLHSSMDDPGESRELDAAIDEVDRLTNLVADLLRLARAEKSLDREPCNLSELTRDRIDTWTASADQAGLALQLDEPGADLWVWATRGTIEQVLDNLLDNAITAAPAGSTITARMVAGDPAHQLAVADNGPGLSDDQKTHASERFWRADTATPGSGLGLAIVKDLVEASRGTMSLDDNAPTGLIVTITLEAAALD